ncbi:MAG: tetratricopeptide repeat protein, partial [Chitinophagaceae bacterium]|nr:tetratricopeptide repeat protein [Chitinophagaceae bacterium]
MSPMHFRQILALLLLCCYLTTYAQRDTAYFMQNFRQGNLLHNAGKIDSSLLFYEKANAWSKQYPFFDTSKNVTELMSVMGRCYRLQNKPQLAHDLLTKALLNARTYHHVDAKPTIFKRLIALHEYIAEKNLPFNYPPVLETEL